MNDMNHGLAKKFQALDKKIAKHAAKKAAMEAAEKKEKERQEAKKAKKQRIEEKKAAKKEAKRAAKLKEKERQEAERARKQRIQEKRAVKKEAKRAVKQEEKERKAQRRAEKEAKKCSQKAQSHETSSSGLGTLTNESVSDKDKHQAKKSLPSTSGSEVAGTSPVPASPQKSPRRRKPSQDPIQRPPSGCPPPPNSSRNQRVTSLFQTSLDSGSIENAVPSVEEPLSTSDDVVGMSYRTPSQRQSPITVQRHSRSSSPARLVSPPSPVTRVSPKAARNPHPPSGYPTTTGYTPSVGRSTSRSSNRAKAWDNNPADKYNLPRYGIPDVNANTRSDSLSSFRHTNSPSSKLQHQTRQQPLRAVHPPAEASTKTSKSSRLQHSNYQPQCENDLIDDMVDLQLTDTPGTVSPVSSVPSRRSSFTMGQRSRGSSSDLRCPPIAGASPPEGASKPKVTRHSSSSSVTGQYQPNFASTLASQSSITSTKIPAVPRSRAASLLQDRSNSEGDAEKPPAHPSHFTSAQHSVLGTGRTGYYQDLSDRAGLIGLENLGNTCYMNSILQCLAQNKALTDYFLSDAYEMDINSRSPGGGNLVRSFAEVMKQLWCPKKREPVAPNKLQSAFQRIAKHFGGSKQQDAQEFLCYFLSELHEETNTAPKRPSNEPDIPDDISEDAKAKMAWERYCAHNNSIFSRLFVGQLKSTLECQTCKKRSVTFDIFWDLSVPVPERPKLYQRRASWERESQTSRYTTFDIKDCLNKFTEAEVLDGENMVMCERCKKKRVFTKSFSIQRFPKYLVLHLKRFSGMRAKLTTHVDFPLQGLDMSRYLTEDAANSTSSFNLCTAVNHIASVSSDLFYQVWEQYRTPPLYDLENFLAELDDSLPSYLDRKGGLFNLGGVSQHSGSMIGGHYIAYAKHISTNKWYCYDDRRVEPITETSVPSSYAYVLFYEQADQQ